MSSLDRTNFAVVSDLSNEPPFIDNKFIRNLHSSENPRLHIFDDKGTLAIIDNKTQIAWLGLSSKTQTNMSFNFAFAKTSDFTKVSRKKIIMYKTGYGI